MPRPPSDPRGAPTRCGHSRRRPDSTRWAAGSSPVNVPRAGAGQLPPSYLYAHYFPFTQSPSAIGVIGLVTSAGTKLAAFGIVDGAGQAHTVGVPFDWLVGLAYYLFAAQLSPTSFGGWVYDQTAASWTFIGQVDLPAAIGKIAPATITQTIWFGPTGGTCRGSPGPRPTSTRPRATPAGPPPRRPGPTPWSRRHGQLPVGDHDGASAVGPRPPGHRPAVTARNRARTNHQADSSRGRMENMGRTAGWRTCLVRGRGPGCISRRRGCRRPGGEGGGRDLSLLAAHDSRRAPRRQRQRTGADHGHVANAHPANRVEVVKLDTRTPRGPRFLSPRARPDRPEPGRDDPLRRLLSGTHDIIRLRHVAPRTRNPALRRRL